MVQAVQVILTHALQPGRGGNNVYIAHCVTLKLSVQKTNLQRFAMQRKQHRTIEQIDST